jgi:anti-sigma regulatory factor (Ser/Thr protein kinase)
MTHARRFSADARSVAAARRFATGALTSSPLDVLQSVELMVSELATNCVRHAHTAFELAIRVTRAEIRVEVTDRGGGSPVMRSPRPTDLTGRGLRIVSMLSASWGVQRSAPTGKTVWFTVPAAQAVDPPRIAVPARAL